MLNLLYEYLTTQIVLLGVTALLFVTIYLKIKNAQRYWMDKGIKYLQPKFLSGNFEFFKTKPLCELVRDIYQSYPGERYFGIYQFLRPILLVKDPALIRQIAVKEFDSFLDHSRFVDPENDPLFSKNLFATEGEKWKDLRSTLSPTFTSSKMKMMYVLMEEVAQQFLKNLKNQRDEILELEVKDIFSRYASDVIASAAFGIKVDSMKDKDNEFYRMGNEINLRGFRALLRVFMFAISPALSKALGIALIPKHIACYFTQIINDTLSTREEKSIVRLDMIHLLTEIRKGRVKLAEEESVNVTEGFSSTVHESFLMKSNKKYDISDTDIIANAFNFFIAGFETVSTFLTFALYELAVNPDIQEKLREEIKTTWEQSGGSKIAYERLLGMKYLDMVVSESLRMWTPAPFLDRRATKAYTIQAEKPEETHFLLEKDTTCWIPAHSIHHDEKYYPNASKFDPERFSDENKRNIDPFTYMPFGLGPRICIGSRFALLEGKLILFHILREFEIVPVKRTNIPMVLDKDDLHLRAKGGMWLGFKRI